MFANPDYDGIFQVDFGDDGFHCHMEGYSGDWEWRNTWQAIKLARGLVSEKLTVLETLDGAGRVKGWEVLPFACWPNTVLRSDCERLQPGVKNPLVDLEGNGWRPPHYRRIVFNRRPFVDTPDWRRYVPVPCGWMSPERWELVRRVEESLGIPKPNRLT
ncbi:MAG: hypothetical protein LIP77_00230 [Planctomycetes bacterium]|nr:hypothetical protein [Planctomycetota bacterium]